MTVHAPSNFEQQHFGASPATVQHSSPHITQLLGFPLTDDEIRLLTGAPDGSTVQYQLVPVWGNTGADKPPPGLYFAVEHPTYIDGANIIGLVNYGPTAVPGLYIKDVHFNSAAPQGMGTVMLARMVRFCLSAGLQRIRLLAAGGRLWPNDANGDRWGGFYFWARTGFDGPLDDVDIQTAFGGPVHAPLLGLFPQFPAGLAVCSTVQEVVQKPGGPEWWLTCGTGWFMEFDCSTAASSSIATLDAYMTLKGK